uniref:Cation-transporting ATPase n=1 Tax=Globisporangium ultimum (strain ATCC 200006 / CBS 805.95 / DAOM BR144) TaxID=431595 RepID=K3W616_GLOUD
MAGLKELHVVPVADATGQRPDIVYAPNEFVRIVPYAFSWLRMLLYCVLVVCSGGLLFILSVWLPHVFTHLARLRLPLSSLGQAHYMLILVHEDGSRSQWVEVKVQHPRATTSNDKPERCWTRLFNRLKSCRKSGGDERSFDAIKKVKSSKHWVWFEFKKHRYAFNHEKGGYERYLATISEDMQSITGRLASGLRGKDEVASRTTLHGSNVVDIDAPSVALLLFTKIMHPFYLFQIFSATVWFIEEYTIYAAVILGLSAISMTWETYCEVSNTKRLRRMMQSDHQVDIIRDGKRATIHEKQLVPGDIVAVSAGAVCADMLLLEGICQVDEAIITGEELPVMKEPPTALEQITEVKVQAKAKKSFLHAGSKVLRVGEGSKGCKAVVLSTGFATGKGELFRSILYPRQLTFEFERDSYRYLTVLLAIAIAAFAKRAVDGDRIGNSFGYTIIHSLDLITIAVPPALPLVLSSGVSFALIRLRNRGIACMDVRRINSCGQLSCFCFDKTGTLTDERLVFANAVNFHAADETNGTSLSAMSYTARDKIPENLRLGMATCHELSVHVVDKVSTIRGSAVDEEMFAASLCRLDVADENKIIVNSVSDNMVNHEIVKRFPFDASVQRSSVLIRNRETNEQQIWVKGSSEAIRSILTDVPSDLDKVASHCAAEGFYCIAFAVKTIKDEDPPIDMNKRDEIEKGVEFVGFVNFINSLKPESNAVFKELYDAEMDIRVITGDNAYTALHVCQQLEMKLKPRVAVVDVDAKTGDVMLYPTDQRDSNKLDDKWEHFSGFNMSRLLNEYDIALTGAALDKLRIECEDESLRHLLSQTQIFARIRPLQKTWIVEQLIDLGQTVGMCGDGTNDCGALKVAHVGLALLSGVEASMVAPFTSTKKCIQDVPVLIREGRCAIVTSFLAFKFMVLYPLIQLAMATTLAHFDLALTNNQYLWDDMAIVLGLAITMLYTGASTELSKEKPPRTLFAPRIIASIAGQVAISIAFFAGHFALLRNQSTDWFCQIEDGMAFLSRSRSEVPSNCEIYLDYNTPNSEYSFEDTCVWLFGHMLFISVAAAFNAKDPFRLPFYTNKTFTVLFLAVLGVNLWFLLNTSDLLNDTFQLMPIPFDYRWKMLVMFAGHFIASILWELVATGLLPKFSRPKWVQRVSKSCKFF